MKNEDLLRAIGALDESVLAESETAVVRKPKRVVRRIVLAAAITALAVLTVTAAANSRFLDLGNAEQEVTHGDILLKAYIENEDGTLAEENSKTPGVRVYLELATNPDAPKKIENAYTIEAPEDWVFNGYWTNGSDDQLIQYTLIWEPYADADGVLTDYYVPVDTEEIHAYQYYSEDYVSFNQSSANGYNQDLGGEYLVDVLIDIPDWVEVTSEIVQFGEISALKVTIPPFCYSAEELFDKVVRADYMEGGEVRLYWSDGDNIFSLYYPAWMTDEDITELLSTLYVVDDMETYLASQPLPNP